VPLQQDIRLSGHAIQCRVTTEDPEQNFTPDYGRITAYRSAAGFGVRLDGGTAYNGAVITPFFDSLLVKVTVWAQSAEETSLRMDRALREFRVRGVATNLAFLENVVHHPRFQAGDCSTRFIDETPELFNFPRRRDRATRLLRFLGETTVNGNPEMQGRDIPRRPFALARTPDIDLSLVPPPGSRDRFKALGADGFVQWIKDQPQVLLTDTTMRDAHQSLLATRMRTRDMLEIAPFYAQQLPQLFSLECWGGATFEVAMRFLHENPWQRLTELRAAVPNILLQMLLRASNAVGYSNYPDNVLRYFVEQASQAGMDVFRVFDALNSVENMRVAMSAVREAGGLCEGTLCYTGDLFDPARAKFNLDYYLRMARELEQAGAHIIGIKDMAGVCRPQAIRTLVHALRQETDLPLHFHTHDTSGMGAASVLAAIDAGVDAVDAAMDAMSGLTSQPNLGAISAALKDSRRDPGLSQSALSTASDYWEGVRRYYAPFEADMRAGSSSVYLHEMPGGQYTNLREQARSLGLGERWGEICQRYAEVNQMFGDIVKVTPTSKVVGDMALYMVAHHLSVADVMNPERQISFPQSVVQLFQGELGMAPEPFPLALQKKILGTRSPLPGRPGALLPPVDLDALRQKLEKQIGRKASDQDLASYLMYPEVFRQFAEHESHYGDVSHLPTPAFFYGMQEQGELAITLEPGKTLLVSLQGQTELKEEGCVKLFFELNGQARTVRVPLAGASGSGERLKADSANPHHLGAAMPGMVAMVAVKPGQKVKKGDALLSIEAMKMETVIRAEDDGTVKEVCVKRATLVSAHDLLLVMS
jgi:pyruvate carboxylase